MGKHGAPGLSPDTIKEVIRSIRNKYVDELDELDKLDELEKDYDKMLRTKEIVTTGINNLEKYHEEETNNVLYKIYIGSFDDDCNVSLKGLTVSNAKSILLILLKQCNDELDIVFDKMSSIISNLY